MTGHDKRAESRVIMEVFGGVPQFLAALGYAPEAGVPPGSASALDCALRLSGLRRGETDKLALEYSNEADRTGRLLRTTFSAQLGPVLLAEGAAVFSIRTGQCMNSFAVPFIDLRAVYKDMNGWVVRLAGSLDVQSDRTLYVALGSRKVDA